MNELEKVKHVVNAPLRLENVYLNSVGLFMPGEPVENDQIDRFIAPLNQRSRRVRDRVLRDNGIRARHYAIDEQGTSLYSSAELAVRAINDCMLGAQIALEDVTLLCTGSSGGDVGMPGFASMVHGELHAPPMEISSHHGVCGAGVQALKHAAQAIALGEHQHALVATSEFPSRLFKRSRFAPIGYDTDFDSHFLRWMLSDGAGACLVGNRPHAKGLSLRVNWIHTRSFAGEYPVCMQVGYAPSQPSRSYLDYPSLAEAEADGAFVLRQNLRLLPNLFDIAIHEYAGLVNQGLFHPQCVDHFLCHYSSEKFSLVIERLLREARLEIPKQRWYSNLENRGNTGAASMFIMLTDFLRERQPQLGERILCFVPESGRFSVGFAELEVVDAMPELSPQRATNVRHAYSQVIDIPAPHDESEATSEPMAQLLRSLSEIWHDYRSRAWRTPLVRRIVEGSFNRLDYLQWMACWIPQVRQGSQWMRVAASNVRPPFEALRFIIEQHAADEQFDYEILFDDYRIAGGHVESIDLLQRNPGGEALNAYMFARANQSNPVGLLGAIYIIEGTGQRIIPQLLPLLAKCLGHSNRGLRFLHYHAQNDIDHLNRWLRAVEIVLAHDTGDQALNAVVATARDTAGLYLMQLEQSI